MKEAPTKASEVARVKVRALQLAIATAVFTAAALGAVTPTAREHRTVAVVHLHPSVLRNAPLLHAAPLEVAPGPANVAPSVARPKASPSMRPALPWWLRRRHIASPAQPAQVA